MSNDDNSMDSFMNFFYIGLGDDPNKWKDFFVNFLRGRTEHHRIGLLCAAYYMVNGTYISTLDESAEDRRTSENLADNNMENMQKIIELIWKNSWEKENWNLDNFGSDDWYKKIIYHEDFKKICQTPIFLPPFYCGILSGEYLLNLLHSDVTDNQKILKLALKDWHVSPQDSNFYKSRRFFEDNIAHHSYIKQFKDNLTPRFCKFEKVRKRMKNDILWDLFEWYGYIEYDLYENTNLANIFEKVFSNPYVSGGAFNFYRTEKIELPKSYQAMIFFKTMLLQNINFQTQSMINEAVRIVVKLKLCTEAFIGAFQNDIFQITSAEIIHKENNDLKKLDEVVVNYQNWIKEKISEIPQLTETIQDAVDEKSAESEELYKFVLLKIICREIQALRATYENAFILSPKIFDKNNQVRLYCEIDPNERILVDDWETFREKYSFQLKKFFPEVTDDEEMKKYWSCAVNVLAFCFPARLGLNFDDSKSNSSQKVKTIPKSITWKWLKAHGVDIGQIKTSEIFSMMYFIISFGKQSVIIKGKGTVFYNRIADEKSNVKVGRRKTLFEALRQIHKHYVAETKPEYNEAFAFQIIWWLAEQENSFTYTKGTIDICRKFVLAVLTAIEDIFKFDNLDFCLKELKTLSHWADSVLDEIYKKSFGTSLQEINNNMGEKLKDIRREVFEELSELKTV